MSVKGSLPRSVRCGALPPSPPVYLFVTPTGPPFPSLLFTPIIGNDTEDVLSYPLRPLVRVLTDHT